MYNIKFEGYFNITPKLSDYDRYYLLNFNLTPRYKRDPILLQKHYNGQNGYKGDYGVDGEYFINYKITAEKDSIESDTFLNFLDDYKTIISDKQLPSDQPGVFCPWKPNDTGDKLIVSDSYQYNHNYGWLKWLITSFFKDKYKLNGEFIIQSSNIKKISIKDNDIKIRTSEIESNKIDNLLLKKNNDNIINDILKLTIMDDIDWVIDKDINFLDLIKYKTVIKVKNNFNIIINLYIYKDVNNNNYLNIYIEKDKILRFYKMIKNFKLYKIYNIINKLNG